MNCIYRIECKDKSIKEIYIGSTCNLKRRKKDHKYDSKRQHIKVYKFINENGGWDNWSIVVEEETETLSRDERRLLEQTYIELLEPELNTRSANGNERKKEYMKEWNKNNKELKKKWEKNKRIYKIITCDNCGSKVKHNIARHKRTTKCINFNSHHPKLLETQE